MSNWRQRASIQLVRASRKLFARHVISELPLTSSIYMKILRFGASDDELTIDFRDIKLTFSGKDTSIAPGLVSGLYEKLELDIFEWLAMITETIIDVGANIGVYCCVAAKRVPASSSILAFEFTGENLNYLRQNIEQNNQTSRIVVEAKVVGESSGKLARNAHGLSTASVPVVTLDEYFTERLQKPVDMLRVDAQGYEGSVLRGAKKVLHKDKPTLFIKFAPYELMNCSFSPSEFLEIIFEIYDHVFLVDRGVLKRFARRDLLNNRSGLKDFNLIAVNNSRQDHLAAVEKLGGHFKPMHVRHIGFDDHDISY